MTGAKSAEAADVVPAPFPRPIARLDVRAEPRPWAFATSNQSRITAHFASEQVRNPTLFNGPMLMADTWSFHGEVLTARLCRTDFASFLYWRAEHRAGRLPNLAGTRNLFGAAAVFSSDGRLLLGQMADHTANSRQIYAPCGSLDPADVGTEGSVDIDGAMARELAEETGLDLAGATAEPGYWVCQDGPRLAIVRAWQFAEDAVALTASAEAHLAADPETELAEVRFVSGTEEIERDLCPPYTLAYLHHRFGAGCGTAEGGRA